MKLPTSNNLRVSLFGIGLDAYPPDRLCRLDATQPPVEVLQEAACNLVRFFTAASSPGEEYRSVDGSMVLGSNCIEVTAAIKKQR